MGLFVSLQLSELFGVYSVVLQCDVSFTVYAVEIHTGESTPTPTHIYIHCNIRINAALRVVIKTTYHQIDQTCEHKALTP